MKILVTILTTLLAVPALAQSPAPKTMDELLQQVKVGLKADDEALKAREAEFVAARGQQKKLLDKARADLAAAQRRSDALEKQFDANETGIAQLEERLRQRLGTMGELFGVIRQVAGDTHGQITGSLISAQLPGREKTLAPLANSKHLPSIAELEQLWFVLQQAMTESGKVARFKAPVVAASGEEAERSVVRVGPFTAVADGRFLIWEPERMRLVDLPRQPASRYVATIDELEAATSGYVDAAIDPSRGSLLSLLVQTKTFREQLNDGGLVGWTILTLGLLTALVALWRAVVLVLTSRRVARQRKAKAPSDDNPLGRVLAVYHKDPDIKDIEAFEVKLEEAVVTESERLETMMWAIKVVSVVAPLMGLLGTVTGMIRTFQAITMFGSGDPKMMASGISEALVTTMEGLLVAIPLVLLYNWLRSMISSIKQVIAEEATGIIATLMEQRKGGNAPAA